MGNAFALDCDLDSNPPPFLAHDLTANVATSVSYCELCGYGYVTFEVANPFKDAWMTNLRVVVDLGSSGLVYDASAPNPITLNGSPTPAAAPSGSGSLLTFDNLGELQPVPGNQPGMLVVRFAVQRFSSPESLVSASRSISSQLTFDTRLAGGGATDASCDAYGSAGDSDILPLREPLPVVTKRGWNYDAGQREGSESDPVYGNNDDDIVWHIRIANNGLAGLQDLRFDDLMESGSLVISQVCATAGAANTIAANDGAGGAAGCVGASNSINDFTVTNPFGDMALSFDGHEVDVTAGGSADIYLVGKITADGSCIGSKTNRVDDVQWGCEAQPPAGGISATSGGSVPSDLATLITRYGDVNSALTVERRLTGTNTAQPVGARGTMTITIRNNTGGSVKGIHLTDLLPPEYVVDPTYTPTVNVTSPYGAYPGRVSAIVWTNENSADPLGNTAPEYDLTSNGTAHPLYPEQVDMLRHGDVAVVTFRVVLIESDYYDRNANLDVNPEAFTAPDLDGNPTDPTHQTPLSNTLTVEYDTFCATQPHQVLVLTGNGTGNPTGSAIPADPEDLDIAVGGTVFILTNDPNQLLTLPVLLSNNGGHDAADYHAFVSFGATMEVVNAPAGCSVASLAGTPPQPDPWKVWVSPTPIPATATVYECTSPAVIRPGQTVTYNFDVRKSSDPARIAIDDLSFRADVVGEILLSDGTPLWFPAPLTRADGQLDRANNYSLDATWARVIGFNLKKSQLGACSENPPPGFDGNGYEQVQIGEECSFHIETGGWFGFETPGFAYIAVQNIDVVDQVPDGQAYISSTDPYLDSTALIAGVSLNPAGLAALDEGWFDWRFNVPDAERIEQADEWFRVNATTRLLNKPLDQRAPPNLHGADSFNVLNSTFDATFRNDNTGAIETYNLGPDTVGYPNEPIRRVDLRVIEPNLLLDKKVCNETLYGGGTGCSNFVDLASDGDTFDSYIYRVTVTNEAASAGYIRAPAYDVTTTDLLDASDLVYVVPFDSDGLDNDGDGLVDAADPDGEGSIGDNVVNNAVPAVITTSHSHSTPLLKIEAGDSVTFYYRVDPDQRVAPLQALNNRIAAAYDSLEGDSGSQSVSPGTTGTLGGARAYTSQEASATVRIKPLQTQPKEITRLSHTPAGAAQPQPVSIGEEVEYELRTYLPVANLRSFVIQDHLPPGIRCSEAPVVNLDAPPYAAAGFSPGGQFTPSCSSDTVVWDFGDQELTNAATPGALFAFPVRFIARVNNSALNNDTDVISNGHPATVATASYLDEAGNLVILDFGQNDLLVREPQIVLNKAFEIDTTDAGDILTVTVTAENAGTANAYNLRVLDDLAAVGNLTFLNNVSGTDPPDTIDTTTFGANRPIFSWAPTNPKFAIAPGESRSFTFEVSVDTTVQPLTLLANTVEASWTSLPSRNTALNSSGRIGPDGAAGGMRNGAVPAAGDPVNDYESRASASTAVPAVSISKSDRDPAQPAEVGSHRQFRLAITLPEGTTENLLVSDDLAASGLSYLLANSSDFDISYSFDGIATINGQPPAEAAFNAFPADDTSGTALWDIGTVVTQREDDTAGSPAITPTIRIDYYARINNDLNTNVGSTLQNGVTVNYSNGETAATETLNDATAAVTVIESNLGVSKSVTAVTPAPITGGDILEYTVTVSNSGNATAYDINLVDTLPPELEFYSGFTPTATINGTAVSGFMPTPAGAPVGPLVWGRDNGDNNLDLPAGQDLVLVYQAMVQSAQPNDSFSNSVWVDWTSLNDDSTYERTGNGCPTITAPDDYCAGPATANTATTDTSTLVKSVVADTFDTAPLSTAADATVRVGDTVTFELALNLQEGVTQQVAVQDVLPAGMAFVEVVSINDDFVADYTPPASGEGSNFSYEPITAAGVPAAGQTGTLNWNLGTIANDPQGDATTDTLLIVYRARVVEDTLAHLPSTVLTNTATLRYVDAAGNPVIDPARLESSASATVLQPVMDSLSKSDRSGRVSGTPVNTGYEQMNFRLTACNGAGQAPAYSVLLSDTLASQFDEASIAGPVNGAGRPDLYVGGVLLSEGAGNDYLYTAPAARGGTMQFLLSAPIDPGECVDIDYDIGFHDDFPVNEVWDNSVTLEEYWSLPQQSGQRYPGLGPVTFTVTNAIPQEPPEKSLVSPLTGEVTIGDEVIYRIAVPRVAATVNLYEVTVSDTLDPSLVYVGASEVSGNALTMTDNSTLPGEVSLLIDQIPAGQQAVIELRVRVDNNAAANAGVSFANTASYTFPLTPGGTPIFGGSSTTAETLAIVEPSANLVKAVTNTSNPGNPPTAGDVLHYTLTFSALGGVGGDDFSDAFDLAISDTLSLGLAYSGNVSVSGAGNTIGAPTVSGDGVNAPQALDWSEADANAAIDVAEGGSITIGYDVLVLDNVLANQELTNSAVIRWTGQDGTHAYERDGSATPAVNDYFTAPATTTLTVPASNTLSKSRLTDTWGAADANVRIGDIIEYELRLTLQEGTSANTVISDTLPQGLGFEGVVSINGDTVAPYSAVAPFIHADLGAPTVSGDPLSGPSTLSWTVGDLVNVGDNNAANDEFVIVYRARVRDQALPQTASATLTNTATLSYDAAGGTLGSSDSVSLTLQQPLLGISKSAAPAGGDTELVAGELVTYTVEISNSGDAPAYDTELRDTIPPGMRNGAATITMVSTTLTGSGTVLPNLAPAYDPASGVAVWNFDTGAADAYTIPAGETLRVVYQVQTDPGLGAGLTLTNQATVQRYYSFDNDAVPTLGGIAGVREIYGPTAVASTTLTTAGPDALAKQNPATTSVAVGEPFTYRITVPASPAATALYDVTIRDDLGASAADLAFVSVARVSGSQPWTPVNTGSATSLVIGDTSVGIDIPAGEQVAVDVTVVLLDTATNASGLTFTNSADYTYNAIDGDPASEGAGAGATTPPMTIVGPDSVTLEKGGPAQLSAGVPGTFTLNVHNTGSGTAWDLAITDRLPNPAAGGMCDAAPTVVSARIFQNDGTTPVSPQLVEGSDFSAAFAAAPACTLTITMASAAAAIGPDQRLLVTYTAQLDADTPYAATLTNIAGATEWFSYDTAGAGADAGQRVYTRSVTDGTVGVLDHEDAHSLGTESPVLIFRQSVANLSTGQDPGLTATPGERLRYRIEVQNSGGLPVSAFTLLSELDALNGGAMFQPGSLSVVTLPAGADAGNTDPAGGAAGSGVLDIRNLYLDPAGGANDTLLLEYEATLAAVIANDTLVLTQVQLQENGATLALSDDPNVNGPDDPAVSGDEDPTQIRITSAPEFEVWKSSADLSGDPAELVAGDTLRYTITVRNVGTENAVNVTLRDPLPANTTYVPGSTTLNGIAVADPAPGVMPLQNGMPVNAPEDLTPGAMRADAADTTANMATVTFDVTINADVVNGTVIANQGFVTAAGQNSGATPEAPSDDPDTPVLDDPTEDVVGNLPLVDAHKTVALVTPEVAGGSDGIVDPGDVLRYTIVVSNFGATPASGVTLADAVPANTTYVADSVTLNGSPAGRPDGGISPLVAGIPVNAPGAASGVIPAGQSAVVTFEVRVDAGTAPGTLISNQGVVHSNEQADEPTDADGIDANGDQPTTIVVGSVQQLAITKEVFVVGGGAATAGAELEYVIRVLNNGSLPATDVLLTDNLDDPVAGQLHYVAGSATLNGSAGGVSFSAPTVTADYSSVYGDMAPGATAVLRFRATLDPGLAIGTTVTNTAAVQWNGASQSASASVSLDVGGIPGVAVLSGQAWHDVDNDLAAGSGEATLAGWSVAIYRNNTLLDSVLTDANGLYRISGLAPNDTTAERYSLRFLAPGHTATTALLGVADSPYSNGLQSISAISVGSGSLSQNLNMPIRPNGVIYDAMQRTPVAGTTLVLLDAASRQPLPSGCLDDPAQQHQVSLGSGYYRFDLNFSDPACPAGGEYLIDVTPPASGYEATTSRIIPPRSDLSTTAFSVPACLGNGDDAVPATADICEVVAQESPPPASMPAGSAGTRYHLHLLLDNNPLPSENQAFNNHIPLDPVLGDAVAISKTSSRVNVSRSEMVPYTITVNNTYSMALQGMSLIDTFPAGFKYVEGSARYDGQPLEPAASGNQLRWDNIDLQTDTRHTLQMVFIVGAGVSEGDYVNRAQMLNPATGGAVSGEASATVRVIPDPTFDCSDIIGKVFDDRNLNGVQDQGEAGLPGARVVSARGLIVTSDEHGRFHITCAAVPNEARGANFILKLDDRSLPSGYRLTTENPRVQRLTRGKMAKFNFGATIHHVVRLDVADGVFEPGTATLREQWQPRIALLLQELKKAPSVLRLAYLADVEDEALVERRMRALKVLIGGEWEALACCYRLTIESEIHWRRGAPPKRLGALD
jgi:uncharacterized repeat protein (TIGR01451 family)/fimbrial isopeptide formation D2 family protein